MKWPKMTTIQINLLIIAVILGLLQGYILLEMNGALKELITSGRTDDAVALALCFAPTGALCEVVRRMATYNKD